MKKNKILKVVLCTSLFVTILPLKNIKAVDFDGQEDKYIKLCSSGLSSSNKATCIAFNKHLDEKYDEVQDDIKETKKQLNKTKKSIDEISEKLESLESEITGIESDISYITNSISFLELSITTKEHEMMDRLYAMQSMYNSDILINFIFGSDDFSTLFSRLTSLTDITSYEKQVLAELATEKKSLDSQRDSLNSAKVLAQEKVNTQRSLQDQLIALKAEQNQQIKRLDIILKY